MKQTLPEDSETILAPWRDPEQLQGFWRPRGVEQLPKNKRNECSKLTTNSVKDELNEECLYYLLYHCIVGNKQFLQNFLQMRHVLAVFATYTPAIHMDNSHARKKGVREAPRDIESYMATREKDIFNKN